MVEPKIWILIVIILVTTIYLKLKANAFIEYLSKIKHGKSKAHKTRH